MWKKIFITITTIIFFIAPVSAAELRLFTTDYDNSIYITENIEFDVAEETPRNWYPLRAMSDVLQFDVGWDTMTKEVVVKYKDPYGEYEEDKYTIQEIENSNKLTLIGNTTYCSPDFLMKITKGLSFWYDDAFYCYNGESERSELIRDNGCEDFREYVNTSMFELYLKYPEDYAYIIDHLDGGIERSTKKRTGKWKNVIGYTYPHDESGVCYVLAKVYGARLTSVIGHEATHIYQACHGLPTTEELPDKYDEYLYDRIKLSNEVWDVKIPMLS